MKCLAPAAWAVIAALLLAVPAHAAGLDETTAGSGPASNITTLSPATLAALQQSQTAQTQPATSTPADAGTFLKSKKGAAVLVLIGVGFAYTLYSQQHDRVLSQIR